MPSGRTAFISTAPRAGHSKEIAARLTTGRLIALDQDPDAVAAASQRLEGLPATVVQSNFRYADRALAQLGVDGLDGVLLDLGVSSHQLDEVSRGFSYQGDAPLDMRMSQSGPTAADLVNTASRAELCRILKEYGEEPYAWQIAGKIESARAAAPVETTAQLVQAVASALPPAVRRKDKNPARRTFQALRIDVNNEYEVLEAFMEKLPDALAPGGRAAILTFHSGEDRLVKKSMKGLYQIGIYSEYSKEVIRPSKEECIRNSRASSTKMRWAIKAE